MQTLSNGSQGDLVRFAQNLLNDDVVDPQPGNLLVNDGIFGRLTQTRVRDYIAANLNRSDPGVIGPDVWRRRDVCRRRRA